MKVYANTLSLILVQLIRAEDPSYFPTVVWDDYDDDAAGSSNLGIASNITVWPTYSPDYYDDETDDYSYYNDDETDDYSYSNYTQDDYSYENELDRYDSSSITEVHVAGDNDSNGTDMPAVDGSSDFTVAAAISENNSVSGRGMVKIAALAPLVAVVYML